METKKEKNKKPLFIIPMVLVVVIIAVIGIFFSKDEKGYRLIQVYQVNGEATIERESVGLMDAYENLNLISGDLLTTLQESFLRLKLDEDKYLLAEENSVLKVYALGDAASSKTDIELEKGAITIEVENKLNEDSSFEITTPNSVMAVRGTVFRITTDVDEAGNPITKLSIFEGAVTVQKKNADGTLEEEVLVEEGKEALIYIENEEEKLLILDEIDMTDLPLEVLEFLKDVVEKGRALSISEEELDSAIEKKRGEQNDSEEVESEVEEEFYTVTFTYKGNVFGTQKVKAGETASKPSLMPAPSGKWDFDFTTPITEDTEIKFK